MFRHPSYYKKLRERNKSDRAISSSDSTEPRSVRPGLGHKQQATSSKPQASSSKRLEPQATSIKPQA